MECPSCRARTPEGGRFCIECGSPLPRRCPACGEPASAGAKFCAQCGSPLAAKASPAAAPAAHEAAGTAPAAPIADAGAPAPPPSLVGDAERRQLTVVFVDLVDSTPLAGRVDAEDLREVIGAYTQAVEAVVQRYDGHVANYMGDGVLAYFGYPRAHEDDARRACLAGLDIVAAVRDLNARFQRELGVGLAARVGIHTGTAVIGTAAGATGADAMAVGETLHVASRLQNLAEPGGIVASGTTARLVRGLIDCESLGTQTLRGLAEPVDVWRVVRASGAADRVTALSDPDLAALIGRDAELQVLVGRWTESRAGRSRVVLLRGDAGMGKSRLLRALRDATRDEPCTWLECRGSSYYSDSALRPIIDMAPAALGLGDAADDAARITRIEALASRLGLSPAAAVPLLAGLLGIPLEGTGHVTPAVSPQILRQRTLQLLVELIVRSAAERPVAFVVEDIHLVDQSTLEFLELLVEHATSAPLFVLLIGRTDFPAPAHAHAEIVLRRLPADAGAQLVLGVTRGKPLPANLTEQILERADGNPLFIEELTRAALESGQLAEGPAGYEEIAAADIAIPASLQESLMARLDRIAPARTVVQVGAAIGRQFGVDVLCDVLRIDQAALRVELDRLVEAGILVRRGMGPTYAFRHALVQDAAYQSMTRRTRRACHARIAAVLAASQPDTPPEVRAHHHAEAGDAAAAADHWYAAGAAALGAFALAESINHLERGLAVTDAIADPAGRAAHELRLRALLGVPLMLRHGFAAPVVAEHYQSLYALCERVGEAGRDQLFPALWGLWTYYEVSARYERAEDVGRRLLDLADAIPDSGIRLGAHIAYGAARLMRGDLRAARTHFEAGLALYDAARHAPLAMLFGQDGGAMCASFLTWVHAHEGDERLGRERAQQALELCERLGQPATQGFVEAVLASFNCVLGAYDAGEAHARRVIALGVDQGMPHWEAQGHLNLGWALQGQGRPEEALPHFAEGLAGFERTGTRAALSYFRAAEAEALLRCGRLDDAERVLDELDAFVAESDERYYVPVALCLRGRIALERGDAGTAARTFELARQTAVEQCAHGFVRLADEARASVVHV